MIMVKQNILVIAALLIAGNANAEVGVGGDCSPRGIINITKEAINPRQFWQEQVKELAFHADMSKKSYRADKIEARKQKIDIELDAKQNEILFGVEPIHDPALERQMAQDEIYLEQLDMQMLRETLTWTARCTDYAQKKLSQIK